MKSFSIKEALSFGWAAFKGRVWFFVGLLALVAALTVIPRAAIDRISSPWLAVPLGIALQLFQWFLVVGLIKISLAVCDNAEVSVSDIFSGSPVYVKYVLATILYGLIGLVGLVLLIVPGVILLIMYGFYSYLIVEKDLGPVDALKRSAAVTQGARWWLFVFGLAVGLLNVAGALALFVGLFVTVPVSLVATAFVYRKLLSQTEAV